MTDQVIENRITIIEKQLSTIIGVLETLDKNLKTKINRAELLSTEAALQLNITSNADSIRKLEEKLATIVLPEDTMYYLESADVDSFKSNFNKLQAMLAEANKLYKNIVNYTANK